jgi:2-polyprenyl-3-methyl-5-hydroxy-6-metoxy-1,4-benzoquinol methylase
MHRTGDFEKQWRERFETFAESHDHDAGIAGWSSSGLAARFRHFVRLWQPRATGAVWLDAGCGAGTYSRYMADQGAQVMGMDYSFPTLEKAKKRSQTVTKWTAGDVTRLPLKSGYFDGVICFGVTQALSDSRQISSELARIVKPGGIIWIDALNAYCVPHMLERAWLRLTGRPAQMRFEFPRRLCDALRKAGGLNIQLHWLPILPQRWQRFQWIVETHTVIWLLHHVPLLGALLSHAFVISACKST